MAERLNKCRLTTSIKPLTTWVKYRGLFLCSMILGERYLLAFVILVELLTITVSLSVHGKNYKHYEDFYCSESDMVSEEL